MKKLLIILAAAIIAGSSLSASADDDEIYYYEFVTTCGGQHSESSYVEYTEDELKAKWEEYQKECEPTNTGIHDVTTLL